VYENGIVPVQGYSPFAFGESSSPSTEQIGYENCEVIIKAKSNLKVTVKSVVRDVKSQNDVKLIANHNNRVSSLSTKFSKRTIERSCNEAFGYCSQDTVLDISISKDSISYVRREAGS
jgi:hypothetical protein